MNSDGCDHICMNIPGSYNCSCNRGYTLNNDSLTCAGIAMAIKKLLDGINNYTTPFTLDIDECEMSESGGMCNHTCVNTLGSYECQCNIGYRLLSDGFTCEGSFVRI